MYSHVTRGERCCASLRHPVDSGALLRVGTAERERSRPRQMIYDSPAISRSMRVPASFPYRHDGVHSVKLLAIPRVDLARSFNSFYPRAERPTADIFFRVPSGSSRLNLVDAIPSNLASRA